MRTLRRATVTLPDDRPLWLGIVADTHGRPHPRATSLLARTPDDTPFDAILHGGDVGDLRVLDTLAACAPVHAVRGNIDGMRTALPESIVLDIAHAGASVLRLLLTHIAVNGPRLRSEVAALAQTYDATAVICGHSHVPFLGRDRDITIFNPGSIGPRRLRLPITLGMMRIARDGVRFTHHDCETGERWMPSSKS
jgi:putative phosphoesterase